MYTAYTLHAVRTSGSTFKSLLQSLREEPAELLNYKQRDQSAFYSDFHALLHPDTVLEQIDTTSGALAGQRLKEHWQQLQLLAPRQAKQMVPRLVHLKQSFPDDQH